MLKALLVVVAVVVLLLSMGICMDVAKAQVLTVTVKADGSLEPPSKLIQREGNIYRVMENLTFSINVQKSDIVLDGENYTLQGPGSSQNHIGITLMASNITVRNFHISDWKAGVYGAYNNNTITKNVFVDNYRGIALYASDYFVSSNRIFGSDVAVFIDSGALQLQGDNNLITQNQIVGNNLAFDVMNSNGTVFAKNNITDNNVVLMLGMLGTSRNQAGYHMFYLNNFMDNKQVLHVAFGGPFISGAMTVSPAGYWDNGSFGNYWSDYSSKYPNASESDHSGLGDQPYLIEQRLPWSRTNSDGTQSKGIAVLGIAKDNRPLIKPYLDYSEANLQNPTPRPSTSAMPTLNPASTINLQVWTLIIIAVGIAILIAIVNRKSLIKP